MNADIHPALQNRAEFTQLKTAVRETQLQVISIACAVADARSTDRALVVRELLKKAVESMREAERSLAEFQTNHSI